ncbi:MAG: hypothetical protein JW744_02470 [Candidatus Diapherotrites archaeon]|uniref:Uncharacterized protein n=1 Tax=Candidatus Iainarchaeum sp. TaxID=3101447 RepID=A0A939C8T8_9ARCH|nr:hypothetical protein [Candidatus Diapherotrites archaeon]
MAEGKKPRGKAKKKPKLRVLTPQEIIDYYREHRKLPPEMERTGGK